MHRIPVVKGEIHIGDRAYLQPDRTASVLDAGADTLVRAGWKNARWLNADGLLLRLECRFRLPQECREPKGDVSRSGLSQ